MNTPFRDASPVKPCLTDATGRIIWQALLTSNTGHKALRSYDELLVDQCQLSRGIYFLTFSAGAQQVISEIVCEQLKAEHQKLQLSLFSEYEDMN